MLVVLSEEFYRHCMDMYSVPLKEVEMQTRIFPRKHLNIVDPLKEYNNLGRSVSEGRTPLLQQFRHGSGHRPDVQNAVHILAPTPTNHAIFNESNNEGEDGVCIFPTSDTSNTQQIGNRTSDEILQEPEEGTNIIPDLGSEAQRHVGIVDVASVTYSTALSNELFNTDSSLASANNVTSPDPLDLMLDLRGGFETQFNILQYGRCFYLFGSNVLDWPVPPPRPLFQSAHSSDAIQSSSLMNEFPFGRINGLVRDPRLYPVNSMLVPHASYGFERPRPRGTGTFFPILNRPLRGYKPSSVEGMIQAPERSFHSIVQTVTSSGFPTGQGGGYANYSASLGNADVLITQDNRILVSSPFHAQHIIPFQGSNMQPRPASSFQPTDNKDNKDPLLPSHLVFNLGTIPGIYSPKGAAGLGIPHPPFSYARGTGTGTLSRHLENIHSITKVSHERGEARRGPQQSQLGGFMTSTGGGVLAKIAKDILVISASTIASESAFSAGKIVLDEKRSSLAPDVVKILVCKKDWDQADKRQQGRKEDSDDDDEPWMTMDTSSESGSSTSEQL
ncbi:hypothetical protein AgCh_039076 [Apium graveolens]